VEVAEYGHITEQTPHRLAQGVCQARDVKYCKLCVKCHHGLEANQNCSGSEVSVFWAVTHCYMVKVERYFGEIYSLHLQVRK
jgi:hypothetical protein